MGLWVSYYTELVRIDCVAETWCEKAGASEPFAQHIQFYNMKEFAERAPNLPQYTNVESPRTVLHGCYRAEREEGFSAGSYGTYNAWRNELATRMHGVDARTIWDDDTFRGKAFYDLISFSDCEGTISGDVAEKLARDFEENREEIFTKGTHTDEGEQWFRRVYDCFAEAFRAAAKHNGAVEFC